MAIAGLAIALDELQRRAGGFRSQIAAKGPRGPERGPLAREPTPGTRPGPEPGPGLEPVSRQPDEPAPASPEMASSAGSHGYSRTLAPERLNRSDAS